MANIFGLEVNNLSKKEKKEWLDFLTYYNPHGMEETNTWVGWSESVEKTKKSNLPGKTLKKYFADNKAHFIKFQKHHKNSIYNQTIKKHGFKDLSFEDVVKNLMPKQKDETIENILDLAKYLKSGPKINHYASRFDDVDLDDDIDLDYYYDHDAPYINKISNEDRDNFKHNENYKNNKYVLIIPDTKVQGLNRTVFFKDDDELILFGLKNEEIASNILSLNYVYHQGYLDPHYQVNQWIEKKYELEQALKDNSKQTQKFEAPKKKMKM